MRCTLPAAAPLHCANNRPCQTVDAGCMAANQRPTNSRRNGTAADRPDSPWSLFRGKSSDGRFNPGSEGRRKAVGGADDESGTSSEEWSRRATISTSGRCRHKQAPVRRMAKTGGNSGRPTSWRSCVISQLLQGTRQLQAGSSGHGTVQRPDAWQVWSEWRRICVLLGGRCFHRTRGQEGGYKRSYFQMTLSSGSRKTTVDEDRYRQRQ